MSFEDRLWDWLAANNAEQLEAMRHEPSRFAVNRRRRPTLPVTLGGGLAAAAMAGAAVLGLGLWEAPPAFAVTMNADGTVTVTLREVSAIAALNKKLAADGIRAKAIPVRAGCANPPPSDLQVLLPAETRQATIIVTINPATIPQGDSEVLSVQRLPSGRLSMFVGTSPIPVANCVPPIPTGPRAPTATSGASS